MNTAALLWALWSTGSSAQGMPVIVSYFETQDECSRIVTVLRKNLARSWVEYQCIQAKYVLPK